VLFGLYLGQRLGDLAGLTWRAVDLDTAEIAFSTRKTGRRIVLPLVQPLTDYSASLPASQSCQNLFSDRRVSVDSDGACGGGNWADPVTRHRNTGRSSERVAHFLRNIHDPLWLCREHYVFARVSSQCRCAKYEGERDTRASNRGTAQATKPVFHSHAVIMIPFRILGNLI